MSSPSYASTGSACAHGRTLIHDVIEPPAQLTSRRRTCFLLRAHFELACHPKLAGGSTSPPSPRLRRTSNARYASVGWWSQTGSNRRPEACKATALPTELWPRSIPDSVAVSASAQTRFGVTAFAVGSGLPSRSSRSERRLVGPDRFELSTPRLSSVCSNQLSYGPSPA
jgi:hypothetical protein